MHADTNTAEAILHTALEAVQARHEKLAEVLDQLPAAIYLTDKDGVITYFNTACVLLPGRTPTAGSDSWCVTWRLFTTDGEVLPHDQCPMAVAIRERRPVRGVEAVAERPDGTRVSFLPYPTPLFDDDGNLVGAVNMLIDVTPERRRDYLEEQARKCRRLADSIGDPTSADTLNLMAAKYDEQVLRLGRTS